MQIFKHGLHNSLSLKKLNINNCGLEDSAWYIEMLSYNKSLIELTIRQSVIHEGGLSELVKGLVLQNISLQILNIDEHMTRAIERQNRIGIAKPTKIFRSRQS